MTDIPRLIEKLEAATEGSITLDVEVLNACGFGSSDHFPTYRGQWLQPTRKPLHILLLFDIVAPGALPYLPYYDLRPQLALRNSALLMRHLQHCAKEAA